MSNKINDINYKNNPDESNKNDGNINNEIKEALTFDEMEIKDEIKRAISDMGFEQPSPIQAKTIPTSLMGYDVIGQAQTGTGKTAAFSIPMLNMIDPYNRNLQALVLCPTRELAIQISKEVRKLCEYMHGIKILPVYGGQPIERQIKALKGGVQIVIGTPGRVIDHINRRTLKLESVNIAVLDEADEMLDMGFREDIETILAKVPNERQTMLFSATMPKEILALAREYQNDPVHIKVVRKELTVSNITQYFIEARPNNKVEILTRLIDVYNPKLSVVFCNTKKGVDELVADLQARGYFADSLHGDMKQAQRDIVMNKFRSGSIDVLVATDVAARGIDVDDVEIVFNYDIPQDEEYYVHRIGRTGRAGRQGMSFSLVFGREMRQLKDIEKYTKSKIQRHKVPTVAELEDKKAEKYFEEISGLLEGVTLNKQVELIENFMEESEYSVIDLAAAMLKLAMGEEKDEIEEYVSRDYRDRRNSSNFKRGRQKDMARLFINVGSRQRIKPKDLVGTIAGESGIPGNTIGNVDIYEKFSFVEVPNKYYKRVIRSLKNRKIKGNKINIERANSRK